MAEPAGVVRPLFDTPEGRAAIAAKAGTGKAPAPAKLTAPDWLSPSGGKAFRELVDAIRKASPDDALAPVDVFALALAAEQWALARAASKAMRGQGGHLDPITVDEAHRDRLRKHPAVQVLRDASALFLRIVKEFGGTPAARRALEDFLGGAGIPDDDEDDETRDLFGD